MSDAGRVVHPFSTGTEHMDWAMAWCDNCLHDHGMHNAPDSDGDGCPLILHALLGPGAPMAWQPMEPEWRSYLPAGLRCAGFERCACDEHPEAELMRTPRHLWPARVVQET